MFGVREFNNIIHDLRIMTMIDAGHWADCNNNIWLCAEKNDSDLWNVSVRYPQEFPDKLFAKYGGNIVARNLPLDQALTIAKSLFMIDAAIFAIQSGN